MNLETIPPGLPFLDALARRWLDESGPDPLACADGLILLPTRRSARALREAFLRANEGRALLLPRIGALGALDEAPLELAGALDLAPAIPEQERLAVLARMVMARAGREAPITADQAWPLAAELARLLDEAHRAGVDLADALPDAVAADYAEHWARTLDFLRIVTRAWPDWLAAADMLDPAARGVHLLRAQAAAWEASPPVGRVIVAGQGGGNVATAALMRVVVRLPRGLVVLPGLDLAMAEEDWSALTVSHPQAGMRGLLSLMNASRGDVRPWAGELPVLAARAATLWRALLPAKALGRWTEPAALDVSGLARLTPADEQEEARAIALALRQGVEQPGARVALVTPDRALAARVAAELGRYGVVADDSAGEALADTPPGAFLRLLARTVAEGLAPVSLLSVLKHPLAGLGLSLGACRQAARALERRLRGPAPAPGLAGLRVAVAHASGGEDLGDLLDRLEGAFAPVMRIAQRSDATPAEAMEALLAAAEAVATTADEAGAARLWEGEEGEALALHLAALRAALPILPAQPVATLPGLLDASLEGAVVRGRRAVRGRDAEEHPRVLILGLLEARLQSFDLVVLGGLVEGVWPPAAEPGPWMSRPIRLACGLPVPEDRIGVMAHDFALLACAAPRAILSAPRRREGAPAVPARWLVRLEALLRSRGEVLAEHPAASWARALDQPAGGARPVSPPEPRPPLAARPRRLSVTEIETWQRDPYAIYARHVLRLRALPPLEEAADASDYGQVVHTALSRFVAWHPRRPTPADAATELRRAMDAALDEAAVRPALAAWWRPRLHRIADWVAEAEAVRRHEDPSLLVQGECQGEWAVPVPGAPFLLRGRTDRIERRRNGSLAILDYKTGTVPDSKDILAGLASQLPLEAAMAAGGAFGPELQGVAEELVYWRLTGGQAPGQAIARLRGAEAVRDATAAAEQGLASLVLRYDDPAQPYRARPDPAIKPRFSDYAQLARVAEWDWGGGA